MSSISISIVEDDLYIREAWKTVLSRTPDCEVIGEFGSCEEALASSAIGRSRVVLMDIGLPGMSGIEGIKEIRKKHPEVATVVCTVFEEDQKVFDAICAGAVGYLLKDIEPRELVRAIHDAAGGGSPMTPNVARKVIAYFQKPASPADRPENELTDRELETLNVLADGKSYAEIAEKASVSIDAIRSRIRSIYMKLQVHSRGEAVAKGLARRIINRL